MANQHNRNTIFVTSVNSFGPYLKIAGQFDTNALKFLQTKIQYAMQSSYPFDQRVVQLQQLQPGKICLYKRIDAVNMKQAGEMWCRAQISSSIMKFATPQVQVELIDYGSTITVHCSDLLFPQNPEILQDPPLSSHFIMLGICAEWKRTDLEEISRMILNKTLNISIEMEIERYKFIKLVWKDFNLAEYLVLQKQIGAPVSNELLRDNFVKMLSKQQQFLSPQMNGIMTGLNDNKHHFQNINVNNNLMYQHRTAHEMPGYPLSMQLNQNVMRPCAPVGNLLSMNQGMHYQKNVSTFIGHSINTYTTRYTHPTPPEPLRCSLKRASASFKSNNLAVGSIHDVCISFVENGPCLFSVQLVSAQEELSNMMNKIETVPLKQFSEKPSLGTACVARYSEDGQLYRALITSVQPTSCKVAYIDYGNVEMVAYRDLFEIPDQFLDLKVFAIRFTLSGYKELEPIDENLKKTFKDMVIYKKCNLKVMPLEGPPLVQYCELYLNGKNVQETLKEIQKYRLVFPKAETLHTNDIVEIRYIDSPKHFYVQKICNIDEFEKLMDDMFVYYNKNQIVPNKLSIGSPCVVKYENEWYRAEVINFDSTFVIVRHVDFGYEQKVTNNLLSTISEQHLRLPRQAIQCCLKGFENNELSKDLATTQFEMLAEESNRTRRSFTVKVFRIQPSGTNLVNLCAKDLNVMKKLYKLSMPFDQYLSLEREEFNTVATGNGGTHSALHQNGQRNPESNLKNSSFIDAHDDTVGGVKKQNNLHSPTNAQLSQADTHVNVSTEWDKNSSASSVDHDAHSISSEYTKKRGGGSSNSNSSHGEKRVNRSSRNLPPRLQYFKNQENENRRFNKYQSNGQQKPQSSASKEYFQPLQKKDSDKPQQERITVGDESQDGEEMIIEEYVSLDREFPQMHIDLPAREDVTISWWISPHQFYTHLKSRTTEFEDLMRRIQSFYKSKPITQLPLKVNSYVIARHRDIKYRARIIACNQMLRKFKVQSIDFGNQFTVSDQDIWQVEKRFHEFPSMAFLCSFSGIVSNYDHLYIVDQMEKYLIPDSVLHCEYIERDDEMYYVNVNVNGLSLRETLIKEGLITEVCPELRLQLLASQQIRANIVNITDMLNFQIQIESCDPHIKFLCSYDDIRFVKSNPEIAKKFKDFYEGKSCVLNITNVTENKVILVHPLIPLFKEDIPTYICSYPVVLEAFKARVVFIQSSYRLFVQMIANEHEVAQLIDDMYAYYEEGGNELENLGVDAICAANGSDGNWYRAKIVARKCNDNIEVYYLDYGNTEVLSLQDEFGKQKIKQLEPQFYKNKSALAIEINLPVKSISADQKKKKRISSHDSKDEFDEELALVNEITTLTSDYELTVKAIEVRKNRIIADICSNEYSIIEVLKEKGLIKGSKDITWIRKILDEEPANILSYIETVDLTQEEEELKHSDSSKTENIPSSDSYEPESSDVSSKPHFTSEQVESKPEIHQDERNQKLSMPESTDRYANMEPATLSHCDNPCRFFLHLERQLDDLHKLQENLQIVASSLPPLMRILKGANCVSLYSVDHQWYRAKIMDLELMVVQFIDYGNTDALTETTDIKEMNVFSDIEPLCIPCALAIKPNGTADWVDAANNIFNNSYNKTLHFEYIVRGESGQKSFIRLFIDQVDVAEKLIADGFASPLELVPTGQNCFVSHINTLSDFYIQMEDDAGALELIESYLSDHEQLPLIEDFTKDLICAALFPDDGNWYRAKLLNYDIAGYEVLFIDYGNTAVSPSIKKISEEIAQQPFLSKKCALHLPDDIICWSEAAEKKFFEMAALGETVFVVELKEPSDHAIVDLFADGCNIVEFLAPLCSRMQLKDQEMSTSFCNTTLQTSTSENHQFGIQDAIISHINSPYEFYIQLNCDGDKLEDMTTTLNEIGMDELKNPEVGMICAAKFSDDGSFYRTRILAKSETDGEYHVFFIDFGNDALANDLRMLPDDLQRIKELSKLCSLENISGGSENIKMFNTILNECNGVVKVEIIDNDCTPAIVKLYTTEGESLSNKMATLTVKDDFSHNGNTPAIKYGYISHAISPEEFYIQKKSQNHQLEMIIKELNSANTMQIMHEPQINTMYAAFSCDDDVYYRVILQKLLPNKEFEVFAVDFGHTFFTNDLRKIPTDMINVPNLAQKCCLNEVPIADADAIQEHFSSILESHFGEMYQIDEEEVLQNGVLKVKLQINYQDVAESLRTVVEQGKTNIEISSLTSLHDCTIIHINSLNSFYVQRTEDVAEIEKITDILLDAESNFEQFDDLSIGAICAAQFPEDGAFYRAKILSICGQECEVLYLDFGNTSTTTEFRTLPENLIDIEAYGKHCCLENLSEVGFWSNEANIFFNELIDSRFSETFQIEVLKTSTDPIIVRLFYQEKNVAQEVASAMKKMENNTDTNDTFGVSSSEDTGDIDEEKYNKKDNEA